MFILSMIQIINQGLIVEKITIQKCLFSSTVMAKNRDKQKYVYRDYGIIFLGVGVWGFVDDSAKNAIVFGVGNSSSFDIINRENNNNTNNFRTFEVKGSFGSQERNQC